MAGGDDLDTFLLEVKKKRKDKEEPGMDEFLGQLQVRGNKKRERKEREQGAGHEGGGDRGGEQELGGGGRELGEDGGACGGSREAQGDQRSSIDKLADLVR